MANALYEEAATLRRLVHDGFTAARDSAVVEGLRRLADMGEALRRRYCNACNYQWACTDSYEAGTEKAEKAAERLAAQLGLHIYLQSDPRGAVVYVSPNPIPPNSYSSHGICLFFAGRG